MAEGDDKEFGPPPREESSYEKLSCTTRSHITESTDSCSPTSVRDSTSVPEMLTTSTEISVSISRNGIKKGIIHKQTESRIRCDGPGDYTIQYVGVGQASKRYLKLNDCVQVYRLEMSTSDILPYPTDPKYAKYLFNWVPKKPQAGFLKVMVFYVVLDLNTNTQESPLKIIANEPPLDDASLVCREEVGNGNFILLFKYKNKRYVIKPDDQRGLTVEEESGDKPTSNIWKLDEH